MSKFKKIIGIVMTFVLCIATFSGSFKVSDAVENAPKLVTTPNDTLPFPITIRDFKADYVFFEADNDLIKRQGKGMVEDNISSDGKPIINKKTIIEIAEQLNDHIGDIDNSGSSASVKNKLIPVDDSTDKKKDDLYYSAKDFYEKNLGKSYANICPTITKSDDRINDAYKYVYYYVNRLFLDTDGLNIKSNDFPSELTLSLKSGTEGTYEYKSGNNIFFPIDGKGFGNEGFKNLQNQSHNFHFTLESHTNFWFEKGKTLTFDFNGDDDVWVYINGKLVIDIGGQHSAESQSITIRPNGEVYNKELNKVMTTLPQSGWYSFDFFFIERHTTESNLNITTNMVFKPRLEVNKEAYIIKNGKEENATLAYPGDTIYYKFGMTNTGNVTLNDLTFQDEKLGISINKSGVYKGNTKIDVDDLIITKKNSSGVDIDTDANTQLSKLESLGMGQSISIKCRSALNYTVTDEDAEGTNPQVVNEVIGSATYEGENVPATDDAKVSVKVNDITPLATIEKIVQKVTREDTDIYTYNGSNSNNVPSLKPGDEVTFKLILNNETISPNTGAPVPLGSLSIEDILSPNEYEKSDWKFYLSNGNEFTNITNFELKSKLSGNQAELELTTRWIVPELGVNHSYSLTNTANLYRTINEQVKLSDDSVSLKIARPSLSIKKLVKEGSTVVTDNTGFTITVSGNDGTKYNVKLKSGEDCTLENLKYGVTYTISELPVMNYKLKGFTTSKQNNGNVSSKSNPSLGTSNTLGVIMHSATDNILVTVNNVRSNDKWFSDTAITENKITYSSQNSTK